MDSHRDTEGTEFDKEARKAGGRAKDLSLAEGAEIAEKEGLVLSNRERARLDKRRLPSGQVTRQGSQHGPVDRHTTGVCLWTSFSLLFPFPRLV